MKLLVATDFPENALGGGPSIVRQMLDGFREEGNQIYWWSLKSPTLQGEGFSVDGSCSAKLSQRLFPQKRLTKIKSFFLIFIWIKFASKSLRFFINKINPDCVWNIPHNWSILPLHKCILHDFRGQLRFHTTIQDYPDIHGNLNIWGKSITLELVRKQIDLYLFAHTCDATSLPMLEDLKIKSGKTGVQMLHEGLENEDYDRLIFLKNQEQSFRIRLAVVGTIIAEEEFTAFVNGLLAAGADRCNLSLEFWGAHSYKERSWYDPSWMYEHGNQSRAELVKKLSTCDWGCIILPLSPAQRRYTQYSFPTKFITYLSAAVPPLVLARPDSAIFQMLDKYNLGMRLASPDSPEFTSQLKSVVSDKNLPKKHYESMVKCATDNFNANKIRNTLWGCFKSDSFI